MKRNRNGPRAPRFQAYTMGRKTETEMKRLGLKISFGKQIMGRGPRTGASEERSTVEWSTAEESVAGPGWLSRWSTCLLISGL